MLTAVLSRVALLGVIDATDFRTAFAPYVMPGVGFLVVFILLGCWLLATVIVERAQSRTSDAPDAVSTA
jgi:hypothetical protein